MLSLRLPVSPSLEQLSTSIGSHVSVCLRDLRIHCHRTSPLAEEQYRTNFDTEQKPCRTSLSNAAVLNSLAWNYFSKGGIFMRSCHSVALIPEAKTNLSSRLPATRSAQPTSYVLGCSPLYASFMQRPLCSPRLRRAFPTQPYTPNGS